MRLRVAGLALVVALVAVCASEALGSPSKGAVGEVRSVLTHYYQAYSAQDGKAACALETPSSQRLTALILGSSSCTSAIDHYFAMSTSGLPSSERAAAVKQLKSYLLAEASAAAKARVVVHGKEAQATIVTSCGDSNELGLVLTTRGWLIGPSGSSSSHLGC
jgi:hypothetical protein